MKIVIEYDEASGRLDIQFDGANVAALGLLEVTKTAIIKKGREEGALPSSPSTLQVRRVGS